MTVSASAESPGLTGRHRSGILSSSFHQMRTAGRLTALFLLLVLPVSLPGHRQLAEAQARSPQPTEEVPSHVVDKLREITDALDRFEEELRNARAALNRQQHDVEEAIARCDLERFWRALNGLPTGGTSWLPYLGHLLEEIVELRLLAEERKTREMILAQGTTSELARIIARNYRAYDSIGTQAEQLQARREALLREFGAVQQSLDWQRERWFRDYLKRCCQKKTAYDWTPPGTTPGTTGTATTGQPPTTGDSLPPSPPSQPPETGARPPSGTATTDIPPQTGSSIPPTQATFCCERCPGTADHRMYFPIPPDTDCLPGDVRREDLPYPQCPGNLFTEEPGPPTYGLACCAGKQDQVLYDSAKSGGVSSEVGSALRAACEDDPCAGKVEPKPGAPMRLETSLLSTGTDVQGRNWVPEKPALRLGKERLKPCHTEPFYVTKESSTNAAAVVLTAISADYADDAQAAEASKGTSCTASHSGASHEARRRDTPQERAAKAAALGLLTSQAKGQIEGLRATFDVTGKSDRLRDVVIEADLVNEVTQRRERLRLPVAFDASHPQEP